MNNWAKIFMESFSSFHQKKLEQKVWIIREGHKKLQKSHTLLWRYQLYGFLTISELYRPSFKGHRNANASSENISPKCALCKGTLGFCCLAERRRPCSCSHAQKQKLTCFISTTYPYLMHPDMLSFGRLKFIFSKKATKIDEIFTVDLTLCST